MFGLWCGRYCRGKARLLAALLDKLRQDTAHAFRGMRRAPGYALAVIVVLGVGVGATTAVFDVLDRLLLRAPAAVARSDDLKRFSMLAGHSHGPRFRFEQFSASELDVARRSLIGTADVAAYSAEGPYSLDGGPKSATMAYVTTNYFSLLGVPLRIGRGFTAAESNYHDPRYVAVISDALWRTRFGADASAIGRRILIDTVPFTIVGVAPRAFAGLELEPTDVWTPLPTRPVGGEGPWFERTGSPFLNIIVRPSSLLESASTAARATAAVRQLHNSDAWFDTTAKISADPLVSAEGLTTRKEVSGQSVNLIVRLAGVALLILVLTACNVGGLQLMRTASRRKEFAIRLALGSSVRRLALLLVTETAIIALVASVVAVELAAVTSGLLRNIVFANVRWPSAGIDTRLAFVAFASVLLVSLCAGLAPLISIAWRESFASFQLSPAGEQRAGSRIRAVLLVVQTSLCISLLGAAGAVVMSLHRAAIVDVGVDARRLITLNAYGANAAAMRDRLSAMPFVEGVAQAASDIRIGGLASSIQLPGKAIVNGGYAPRFNAIEPEYFSVAGLHVREGRAFNATDIAGADAVAVINRSMAQQYWPAGDALGSCFTMSQGGCRRVVGVVDDVRWGFSSTAPEQYYLPLAQHPQTGDGAFVIRTRADASSNDIAAIRRLGADLIYGANGTPSVRSVAERLAVLLNPLQVASTVFLVFGALALLSALAGIFGTVSFDTARRYREIGIRIALGAEPSRIISTVLGSVGRLIVAGIVAGVLLLVMFEKFLTSILFETTLYGSWITWMIAALFLLAGLLAGLLPALRASRVDPAEVLAAE
jgi:predicted permease